MDEVDEIIDLIDYLPKKLNKNKIIKQGIGLSKAAVDVRSEDVNRLTELGKRYLNVIPDNKEFVYDPVNLKIPEDITIFNDLFNYLNEYYDKQSIITFKLDNYNLIAKDIIKYKIYPNILDKYLKHNYPNIKIYKY